MTASSGTPAPSGIAIQVETAYLEARSKPDQGTFAFTYTVTITNDGPAAAQLKNRRWRIMSDNGAVQEVEGDGVVGEQPRLEPGQSFTYTSWAELETPTGQMSGAYGFVTDAGAPFEVEVPLFLFEKPGSRVVN